MYKPAVNVYIRTQHRKKIPHLAGMIRGLLNHYEGFNGVSGLNNEHFETSKCVRLSFSSVRKAFAFQKVATKALGDYIIVKKIRA